MQESDGAAFGVESYWSVRRFSTAEFEDIDNENLEEIIGKLIKKEKEVGVGKKIEREVNIERGVAKKKIEIKGVILEEIEKK